MVFLPNCPIRTLKLPPTAYSDSSLSEHSHQKWFIYSLYVPVPKFIFYSHFKSSCIYQRSPPNVSEVMTFGTIRVLEAASLQPSFAFSLSLCHGATDRSGQGPPHYRGFMITFRHTTLGRTPLDE